MKPTARSLLARLSGLGLVLLALTGCGSDKKSGGSTPPTVKGLKVLKALPDKPGQPPFSAVSKTSIAQFERSNKCRRATWDTNSTATPGYKTSFFRQLDCEGTTPAESTQQASRYITFASPAEAKRYIAARGGGDAAGELALVSGATVILSNPQVDLPPVDVRAYMTALQRSCSCATLGEIPL
jgi:hypothetical protein